MVTPLGLTNKRNEVYINDEDDDNNDNGDEDNKENSSKCPKCLSGDMVEHPSFLSMPLLLDQRLLKD